MIRYGLEKPYVRHRCGKIDMAHSLTPNTTVGNLHAAAVADYPLELGAFVFAARTLPVPLRPKYPLTEQAVFLRSVSPVVDSLGLAHLTERPAADIIRAGQSNLY